MWVNTYFMSSVRVYSDVGKSDTRGYMSKQQQVVSSPLKHNKLVPIDSLTPHTRNYRSHPDDEIAHLMESIKSNGLYRNIVVASDGTTILAGHGVVEAARRLGIQDIPVYSVDFEANDPRALKLLV